MANSLIPSFRIIDGQLVSGGRKQPPKDEDPRPKFLVFNPKYFFLNKYEPVELAKIDYVPELKTYVGIYYAHIIASRDGGWIERYIWLYNKGRMHELKQLGTQHGRRPGKTSYRVR